MNSTAKTIITNVYQYFKKQSQKTKSVPLKLSKKTAEATGYSLHTVEWVIMQTRALSSSAFESPAKCYKAIWARIMADDFDVAAIWRTIHEFYDKRSYPTLKELLSVLIAKGLSSDYTLEVAA